MSGPPAGLDYFGARYYGNNLGRWMSPDFGSAEDLPLEPVPYADLQNPQSLNLYGYVQNNPLNYVDDDGHECHTEKRGDAEIIVCNVVDTKPSPPAKTAGTVPIPMPRSIPLVEVPWAALRIGGAIGIGLGYLINPPGECGKECELYQQSETDTASESGGGKNAQKVNQDRKDEASKRVDDLRKQKEALDRTANKTPKQKEEIEKLKKAIKREVDRMRESENHSQKGKGQR